MGVEKERITYRHTRGLKKRTKERPNKKIIALLFCSVTKWAPMFSFCLPQFVAINTNYKNLKKEGPDF